MITPDGILYIEPSSNVAKTPVIDEATRKITAALRKGVAGMKWRGVHQCACGAQSTNCDFTLPNGEKTNSLAIHYLAYHRSEVPKEQLAKVLLLDCGEEEPTELEMRSGMRSETSREINLR